MNFSLLEGDGGDSIVVGASAPREGVIKNERTMAKPGIFR